jgi:hypothetical protein
MGRDMKRVTWVLAGTCLCLLLTSALSIRAYLGASKRVEQVGTFYKERLHAASTQLTSAERDVRAVSEYLGALSSDASQSYSKPEADEAQSLVSKLLGATHTLGEKLDGSPSPREIVRLLENYDRERSAYDNGPSFRVGATCSDGWQSSATGRGACSHHGGVADWQYGKSGTPPVPPSGSDLGDLEFGQVPSLTVVRVKYRGTGSANAHTLEIQAASGHVYSWDRGTPATKADLDQIFAYDAASYPAKGEMGRVDHGTTKAATPAQTFWLGDPETSVVRMMGTPTSRNGFGNRSILYYNLSRVTFIDGVLEEFDNTSQNLKVAAPGASSRRSEMFTVGSSQDGVITVMGTPSSYSQFGNRAILYYDLSRVTLVGGKVAEYDNTSSNLRVKE